MNSICSKAELPEEWKESIAIPNYKTADKTDCITYRHIQLLSATRTYRILSHILVAKEIIGDHQWGLRRNRSTTDHIFCIHHILGKKWEYNEECITYLYISRNPMI